ncbi:intermembrane transport protein PqiB [Iodobacter ciconiae]|uniref:Intermembrane transport protein PqiB n=1 Tax=Iodobacter ciconiae TaxID=2496266 RepID=A0A3S8ZPB5_9NEIS|nr:intermembrane transport protein PqiB [Iodobacter ciconiae]AZN35317.1 intermembrane transport protein PqiB [Iodobacter ciconiae]
MEEQAEYETELPRAKMSWLRRISLVWLVPIAALLLGAWMVFDTWRHQGPEITLYVPNAEGIEVGKTTVKVLSVNVGKVTDVELDSSAHRVRITARLDVEARKLLSEDSQFWVVKPRVDRSGISGLSTLLSGSFIQLNPGKSENMKEAFTVLNAPPVTAADVPGLRLVLSGRSVKVLSVGDPILYQNFEVGRVEKAEFDPEQRQMNYRLFIQRPYDRLVTVNSRFWVASGVQLSLNADGIKLNTGSVESMLSGGVAFGVPENMPLGEQVSDQSAFTLFPDEASSLERQFERRLSYVALFSDSVRGLKPGAPVELRGLRIGTVGAVPYSIPKLENKTRKYHGIPVLIHLELGRLAAGAEKESDDYWRKVIATQVNSGMVLKLKNGNLLTGALYVDVDFSGKPQNKALARYDNLSVLPTSDAGLAQIEGKVIALLDKLNALKLEGVLEQGGKTLDETGKLAGDVRALVKTLDDFAQQPQVQGLPGELQRTLNKAEETLKTLRSTVGDYSGQSSAYGELNRALGSLNQVLQEARPVIRTLNEKPNALLFDRKQEDIQPKGTQP